MPLTEAQLEILFKPPQPRPRRQARAEVLLLGALACTGPPVANLRPDRLGQGGQLRARVRDRQQWQPWDAAYLAKCRLPTIRDTYGSVVCVHEDAATGSAVNQPSRADAHDLALKSAASDALKRAAKDLGIQLGLSLTATALRLGPRLVVGPSRHQAQGGGVGMAGPPEVVTATVSCCCDATFEPLRSNAGSAQLGVASGRTGAVWERPWAARTIRRTRTV
jgi:Rad52/22 family double-strand break repair protein